MAIVFDRLEDYHHRIDDSLLNIDKHCILFMPRAALIGCQGAAEVVNMRASNYLLKKGMNSLACVGDGRQSGTSGSSSILNASPEAVGNGGLVLLKNGDKVHTEFLMINLISEKRTLKLMAVINILQAKHLSKK